MVETLTPRFLDRRTIDKAYPLVRDIVPGMTAARWTQFVRTHLAPRSPVWPRGVMTIQNGAGYILLVRIRGSSRPPRKPDLPYESHYDPEFAWPRDALGIYDRRRGTASGDERLPRDLGRISRWRRALGQGSSDVAREFGVCSVRCTGVQQAGDETRPRRRRES